MTNRELEKRLDQLESKVDLLAAYFERAWGVWWFTRVLGSIALGAATLWAFFSEKVLGLLTKWPK